MAELREAAMNHYYGEDVFSIYTGEPKFVNKLYKYAEQYPEDVKLKEVDNGVVLVHLPFKWFRMPSPPPKREMTEEQREAARERMRKIHEGAT